RAASAARTSHPPADARTSPSAPGAPAPTPAACRPPPGAPTGCPRTAARCRGCRPDVRRADRSRRPCPLPCHPSPSGVLPRAVVTVVLVLVQHPFEGLVELVGLGLRQDLDVERAGGHQLGVRA